MKAREIASYLPDGYLLPSQRKLLEFPTNEDKYFCNAIGEEYKERFGKESRYERFEVESENKEEGGEEETVGLLKEFFLEEVIKGKRVEWSNQIPWFWPRQEMKGRLTCRYKKPRVDQSADQSADQSESTNPLQNLIDATKQKADQMGVPTIKKEKILLWHLENKDCEKLIEEELCAKQLEKRIKEKREELKAQGRTRVNRKEILSML